MGTTNRPVGQKTERYAPIIDIDYEDVTESLKAERNAPVPANQSNKGPITSGVLRG
jgi:hypothetical protein